MLMVAVTACKTDPDAVTPEQAEERSARFLSAREVRLIEPEVRVENPQIELVGEIRAYETVDIPAETAGKVDGILVEVGDRVKTGDPLVEIDRKTFQLRLDQATAEVAAAAANLALAEKELERKRDLLSDSTIAQAVFDQASSQHDLAKAQLAAAQAARAMAEHDVERSLVRAPAAGSIAERLVSAGSWCDVGNTLLVLASGDTAKVVARVPEGWVARLTGLDGFDFQIGRQPVRHAEIYNIDPVLEGASRSFEVTGTADNRDGALKPGMFANITLTSPTPVTSLWLPETAVLISDLPQVLIEMDGKAEERDVQTGRRDNSSIEILSGLEPGELVIANTAGLHRGTPVTVID
jgi:membrane fusion protein (multidrug efflux system)